MTTGATSSDRGSGSDRRRERRAEGRVRAIYATIILTAVLVGLRGHTESAGDVIEILVGAALMLFIAHTFSDFLARRVEIEGAVPLEEFRELLIVESPLLITAGIPVIVFALAQAGVLSLEAAFWISLSYSVGSLFVIGAAAASQRGVVWGFVAGAVFATLGAAIIAAEASFAPPSADQNRPSRSPSDAARNGGNWLLPRIH